MDKVTIKRIICIVLDLVLVALSISIMIDQRRAGMSGGDDE